MGSPGIRSTIGARVTAALPLLVLSMMGCLNPFSNFYTGKKLADLKKQGMVLPDKPSEPTYLIVRDVPASAKQYVNEGWYYMGSASWVGPPPGLFLEGFAKSYAREIGASLVLVSWYRSGTRSISMPVTTPTTSTTYVGGTVYSGSSTASFSGTATTYGTQTTYQNVNIPQFDYDSAFLCKPVTVPKRSTTTQSSKPPDPILGAVVTWMRPADQDRSGTTMGVVIRSVTNDGPAMDAGLQAGDVIVRIGNAWVGGESTYNTAIQDNLGRLLEFEFYRDGEVRKTMVQLKGTDRASSPTTGDPSTSTLKPVSPYRDRAPTESPTDAPSSDPEPR